MFEKNEGASFLLPFSLSPLFFTIPKADAGRHFFFSSNFG